MQACAQGGLEVCITVTLLDGLVLARSGFHHSMNYRSVMAFGTAEPVTDEGEKERVLAAMVDHIIPGRNAQVLPKLHASWGISGYFPIFEKSALKSLPFSLGGIMHVQGTS